MPPDISSSRRLEKVLDQLENEAFTSGEKNIHEDLINDPIPPADDHSSDSVPFYGKSIDTYIRTRKGLMYVPSSTFALIWSRIFFFSAFQVVYFWALYQVLFSKSDTVIYTWIYAWILYAYSALGITAGAHRLWSHKSYQAKWPLRLFLMVGQCLAGQHTIFSWSRDHRVHHKFSDTDADPHNCKRGFFFCHVGWLLRRSHPDFLIQSNKVYVEDLLKDPIVYWQHKFYRELMLLCFLIVPTFVPCILWNESLWTSFILSVGLRYVMCLHCTWFVNSAAHMFGERPYNPKIEPRQNPLVSFGAMGEGYHNYHHTFPFDYSTVEFGFIGFNPTKQFIDLMHFLGQAYNLKVARIQPERRRIIHRRNDQA